MPPSNKLIFLCHAKEDSRSVRYLYNQLKSIGFNLFFDEENILPGQNWDYEIKRALKKADFILICLSTKSVNKRGYLNKEIKWAIDRCNEMLPGDIFLIPVKFEDCDLPECLESFQSVNCYESKGYKKLLDSFKHQSEIMNTGNTDNKFINTIKNFKPTHHNTSINVSSVKAGEVKIAERISNRDKITENFSDGNSLEIKVKGIEAEGRVEIAKEIIKKN